MCVRRATSGPAGTYGRWGRKADFPELFFATFPIFPRLALAKDRAGRRWRRFTFCGAAFCISLPSISARYDDARRGTRGKTAKSKTAKSGPPLGGVPEGTQKVRPALPKIPHQPSGPRGSVFAKLQSWAVPDLSPNCFVFCYQVRQQIMYSHSEYIRSC